MKIFNYILLLFLLTSCNDVYEKIVKKTGYTVREVLQIRDVKTIDSVTIVFFPNSGSVNIDKIVEHLTYVGFYHIDTIYDEQDRFYKKWSNIMFKDKKLINVSGSLYLHEKYSSNYIIGVYNGQFYEDNIIATTLGYINLFNGYQPPRSVRHEIYHALGLKTHCIFPECVMWPFVGVDNMHHYDTLCSNHQIHLNRILNRNNLQNSEILTIFESCN